MGLQRDISGDEARWIGQANDLDCPKLAIDLPSGLDSDSGRIRGCALRADHTITFWGLKPGLLTADGLDYVGTLQCARGSSLAARQPPLTHPISPRTRSAAQRSAD